MAESLLYTIMLQVSLTYLLQWTLFLCHFRMFKISLLTFKPANFSVRLKSYLCETNKNVRHLDKHIQYMYTFVFRLACGQETLFSKMAECSDGHQGEDQCCSPGHAGEWGDQTAAHGLLSVSFRLDLLKSWLACATVFDILYVECVISYITGWVGMLKRKKHWIRMKSQVMRCVVCIGFERVYIWM